jgi:2-polyprenyl-3-methyl-5-hydroxy-6-metoxy-1,4-benzoquinol methylase
MYRSCPACSSKNFLVYTEERLNLEKLNKFSYASRKMPEFMCLKLVCCNDCTLIYAPVIPSGIKLEKSYTEALFDSSSEANAAAHTYANILKPFLNKLSIKHAAIDVGAGSGPLLPLLKKEGFSPVIGIEPSEAAIKMAPDNVKNMLRCGMFKKDIVNDLKPSLICSFMTLEHISNPEIFLKESYEILDQNGLIAVIVHNRSALLNKLLGMKSPIIDVEHLQLFNPKSLKRILIECGFINIQIIPVINSYPIKYWIRLLPIPIILKKHLIKAFEYFKLADKKIAFNVGNIAAIAYK